MIRNSAKKHAKVLQLAYLEACLEHYGMFKGKYLALAFTQHIKESQRIVKLYKELNPDSLISTRQYTAPSPTFKRKILLRSTDAEHFLIVCHLLFNTELPDKL